MWLRLYTSGPDENYSLALKEFVQVPACPLDVFSASPFTPLALLCYRWLSRNYNIERLTIVTAHGAHFVRAPSLLSRPSTRAILYRR